MEIALSTELAGPMAEKFDFLIVGVPLSPIHNCISIGQDLLMLSKEHKGSEMATFARQCFLAEADARRSSASGGTMSLSSALQNEDELRNGFR